MGQTEFTLNLTRFLLSYRTTPHSTTDKSPSELLMGRQLRLVNILNKTNMKLDGLNVRRNSCKDLFSLPDPDREELGWEITDPGKSD